MVSGQCECRANVAGVKCDQCRVSDGPDPTALTPSK